jgi:hypothetical protein
MVCFFNEITFEERKARASLLDPNKYYQPVVDYVFHPSFGNN